MSTTVRSTSFGEANSAATVSVASPAGMTTGDLFVVMAMSGVGTPGTITDNNGGKMTLVVGPVYEANNGETGCLFTRVIQAGDPSTWSFNYSGNTRISLFGIAYQNPNVTNFDVAPAAGNTHAVAGSTSFPANSITTGNANSIHTICAIPRNIAGAGVTVIPAGYTTQINQISTVGYDGAIATKVITSPGVIGSQTFTVSPSNGGFTFSFAVNDSGPSGPVGTWIQNARNTSNAAFVNIAPTAGNALVINCDTTVGGGSPTVTLIEAYNATGGTGGVVTNAFSIPLATTSLGSLFRTGAYILNVPAGIQSLLLHFNGGAPTGISIQVAEISNLAGLLTTARQLQAAPGTSANAITSGTASVPLVPTYIIGVVSNGGHTTTAAGTNFTLRGVEDTSWFVEDRRETTASGNYAATATDASNGGADTYVTSMFAFSERTLVPIQIATAATGGGATFNVTLAGVTAGSLLSLHLGALTAASGANPVIMNTPTDTNGTWTPATTFQGNRTGGAGSLVAAIAILPVAAAGTHVVTVRCSGFSITFGHATLVEWPGGTFGSTTVVDVAGTTDGTTAQSSTVTTTGSTATPIELVFATVVIGSGAGVANLGLTDPPAGYASLYAQQVTNASDLGIEHCYKTTTAPGVQSAAWTWIDATTLLTKSVIVSLSTSTTVYTPFSQTIFFAQDRASHY